MKTVRGYLGLLRLRGTLPIDPSRFVFDFGPVVITEEWAEDNADERLPWWLPILSDTLERIR